MAPRNENELQEQFFTWLTAIGVRDYAFAIPNGMHVGGGLRRRSIYIAALKRQGLTPGVSDVFISLPRGKYHGLYLELKYGTNKMTAQQRAFQALMEAAGYAVGEARTLDQAKEIVGNYLKPC